MRKGKGFVGFICVLIILISIGGIAAALSLSRTEVSVGVSGDVSGDVSIEFTPKAESMQVYVFDEKPYTNNNYIDFKGDYYELFPFISEGLATKSFNIKFFDADGERLSGEFCDVTIDVELKSTGNLDAPLWFVDGYYQDDVNKEVTSYYLGKTTRLFYQNALTVKKFSDASFRLELSSIYSKISETVNNEDGSYSFSSLLTESIILDYRYSLSNNFSQNLSYFRELLAENTANRGHVYYLITVSELNSGLIYEFAIIHG